MKPNKTPAVQPQPAAHIPNTPSDFMESGWRIVRRDNAGLSDPQDGHRTPRYDYHVYAPGQEIAEEILNSRRAAVSYVNARKGNR